ncbi:phage tail protein [Streptomyces sp. FR-108]|uniref:phage tail protein n=1 Tax=Streptomyces sp. FR-108 TaxID=3416665 RepID=UPI003CF33352
MAGFLIASGHIEVDADVQNALRGIGNLVTKMTLVGPVAIAAGAATTAAVGGITAAITAAGAAVGAFGLAAKPQLAEVTEVTKLYEAAQKAAADGTADAAEKQKAYEQALSKLPPATRDTAVALSKLKTEHKAWSDSLASSTMPLFTRGINILRGVLPKLTPFVRIASFQFKQFLDQLGQGHAGTVFREFGKGLQHHAGGSLNNFLLILKNIATGFVGILNAFMPMSVTMSGGLADLTAKFAAWGAQLGQSSGFKTFMDYVKTNGPIIAQTLGSIAVTIGKLVIALAPLAGITLPALAAIAEFVSKLPPPVILAIAAAITALKVALMAFRIASMLTGTAMWPLITATWAWTAALLANPVTWVILGIVALVAAIVLIATKTTWFQQLWNRAWREITMIYSKYIKPAIDGIVAGFKWLYNVLVGHSIIPDLVNAIKGWWNKLLGWITSIGRNIRSAVVNSWNSISSWVTQKVAAIANAIRNGFNTAKNVVSSAGSAIVSLARGAFSRLVSVVGSQLASAVSRVRGFKINVVGVLSGAGSWLVNAGRSIIQGLVNGIKSMAGSVKSAVGGVLSSARDMLPFSPAKEGPFSGKGWTEYSGASLMQGLATGIDNSAGLPYQSMSKALGGVSPMQPRVAQPASGGVTIHSLTVKVDGIIDLSNPNAARKFAEQAAPAMSVAVKNFEKERR